MEVRVLPRGGAQSSQQTSVRIPAGAYGDAARPEGGGGYAAPAGRPPGKGHLQGEGGDASSRGQQGEPAASAQPTSGLVFILTRVTGVALVSVRSSFSFRFRVVISKNCKIHSLKKAI